MKRFRSKLAGFGFIVLAGSAVAADQKLLPAPQPAQKVVSAGVPVSDEPLILPASVRLASASEPATSPEPIWLPAARTPSVSSSPSSSDRPVPSVEPVQPATTQALPTGQRLRAAPVEPIREMPEWLPQQKPGSDTPVEPVRPMTPPTLPEGLSPRPSAAPTSPRLDAPVRDARVPELPVAPPELMVPDCPPGKHGTFGSPPIRLSRDYPPLSELCGTPVRDWFVSRFRADRENGGGGFLQGEYLLWWMPGMRIPVLATTTSDPNGLGFLGEPGTRSLLSGTMIGSTRQGFRVRGGLWLDDCGSCGIDGSIFILGRRSADAAFASSQFGVITRPIFSPNPIPGTGFVGETGQAVTLPNVLSGGLSAHAESFLWGADANVRHCLCSGCDWKMMGFAGYRFLSLEEQLSVQEDILVTGTSPRVVIPDPIGTTIVVRDTFEVENHFHGGQLGVTYERRRGRWDVDARASIAFGVTHQELDIDGFQVRTRPGQAPVAFRGGLLAAGPNLGSFTRDRFSIVPEFTLNVGYWLTPNLKAYVGYNLIYWTNVMRAGEQIDRVVDLTFVPNAPPAIPSGQQRPAALFNQSDLWVTGVQFGVEWRW
jgi:putative beta barrel porin BBP7